MTKLKLLYITNASLDEAKKIAKHLLKCRLIGCANMFPIKALYWWEGEIVDGEEVVLIVKTTKNKVSEVKREVEKIHPFDTPCILELSADANSKYFEWIRSEIKPNAN